MSSDLSRTLLSLLSPPDESRVCRLDSLGFTWLSRALSLMLLLNIDLVLRTDVGEAAQRGVGSAIFESTAHILALLGVAWFVWTRPKRVIASSDGLTVGKGQRHRFIPWARVLDVRELPWIRFSPLWQPKRFQVDLQGDERFDFVGRYDTRELVIEFVKHSEQA
jgi:hypothetical protein